MANGYAQTSEKIALSKLFGGMAYPLLSLLKIPAACRCSDSDNPTLASCTALRRSASI